MAIVRGTETTLIKVVQRSKHIKNTFIIVIMVIKIQSSVHIRHVPGHFLHFDSVRRFAMSILLFKRIKLFQNIDQNSFHSIASLTIRTLSSLPDAA